MLLQLTLSALLATIAASQGIEPASRSVRSLSADKNLPPIRHDVDATRMENMNFLGSGFSLGLWTAFAGPLISSAPEVPKNPSPLETLLSLEPNLVQEDPVPPDDPLAFLSDLHAFCADSFESGAWMVHYLPTGSVISNGDALLCGIVTFVMAAYILSYQYSLIILARLDGLSVQKRKREKLKKPSKKVIKPNGSGSEEDPTNSPPLERKSTTDLDKITKPLELDLPGSVKSDNGSSDSGSLTTKVNGHSPKRNEDPNPAEGNSTTATPKRGIRLFRLKSPQRKKTSRKKN
mmetsp:Transcript_19580/g.29644  ORF Transcript_19580/g.29644 Transcript_19580/m.29644 type:complete len:291 (+) Transcript_19580:135-1007(+)